MINLEPSKPNRFGKLEVDHRTFHLSGLFRAAVLGAVNQGAPQSLSQGCRGRAHPGSSNRHRYLQRHVSDAYATVRG